MKRIQAKKHEMETYEIDKISLSCFDVKRQVLDDGVHTLAYFHKDNVTSRKKLQKIVPIKKVLANNKMNFSSIVNEVIRPGFFWVFFMKTFYTQKNPTKHPSNVYSDIPIRLKA